MLFLGASNIPLAELYTVGSKLIRRVLEVADIVKLAASDALLAAMELTYFFNFIKIVRERSQEQGGHA